MRYFSTTQKDKILTSWKYFSFKPYINISFHCGVSNQLEGLEQGRLLFKMKNIQIIILLGMVLCFQLLKGEYKNLIHTALR